MRVALTADLQLQSQPRYSVLTPEGVTSRLIDFVDCLTWIADSAVRAGCTHLVVMGDVFDSRTVIDVPVIDRACRAFAAAAGQLEVHVLVGNHDAYLRTPRLNSTQMLAGFATVHESVKQVGPLVMVPWTDNAEDYHASLVSARKVSRKSGRFLLSHGMFGDAVPMAKGLPIEWLTDGNWDGVFLGDVHEPVVLRDDPVIRYVGSPLQIHFGDAGSRRGFVVLDTDSGTHKFVENKASPRFHILKTVDDLRVKPATSRDYYRVRATDVTVASVLVEKAKERSQWVESEVTDDVATEARIKSAGTMSDEELLTAYCKHLNVDADLLVPLGVQILKEARG